MLEYKSFEKSKELGAIMGMYSTDHAFKFHIVYDSSYMSDSITCQSGNYTKHLTEMISLIVTQSL